jgi:hypothetical protein
MTVRVVAVLLGIGVLLSRGPLTARIARTVVMRGSASTPVR